MPVTKFPHLTIWLFCEWKPFQILGQFRGLFKETNGKNLGFCVEKERKRKNTKGYEVTKKRDQNKRLNFLISKSVNMNS